ncbi:MULTISPECIES: ETX/MTX2 family pore-forming toxin [unclassified Spiroplasma]|uniref:ETX/MTX2 family pore-forming toxin n=1 Tax=unclassified Spiroplasma TaxID=2637901 RepID=UPI00313E2B89
MNSDLSLVNSSSILEPMQWEEPEIIQIEEVATKALEWAYRLTNLLHYDFVANVTDIDVSNLGFISSSVDKVEEISSAFENQQVHQASAPLVNNTSDVIKLNSQFYSYTCTNEKWSQISKGINVIFAPNVKFTESISGILKVNLNWANTEIKKEIITTDLAAPSQSVPVPPHSTRYVKYILTRKKTKFKLYLSGVISGNIFGKINLKSGEKIDYSISIGFAAYCLEIMDQSPAGVSRNKDKTKMNFNGFGKIESIDASNLIVFIDDNE